MQNYISSLTYLEQNLTDGEVLKCPEYHRFIIDPHHPSYRDSEIDFTQEKFKYPYIPLYLNDCVIPQVEHKDFNVNVLRLLIRENNSHADIHLPKELLCFKDFILDNINYHRQYYSVNKDCFIYITVRTSNYEELFYKNSTEWHIDGFQGSRIKRHIIEQDIFWCNKNPTQFLLQPMFCEHLDPSKHDINNFFESNAKDEYIVDTFTNKVYLATPYNIHRVNKSHFDGNRVFVRLNFSPVEIEDFTNTINPMLKRVYPERRDVRDFLRKYNINERNDSGLILP